MPKIVNMLPKIMKERGISGKELSKRSGVSESAISMYKYRTAINMDHTAKLIKALGLESTNDILKYVPDEK